MRSPSLTHFRWWPRNLSLSHGSFSRTGYATFAVSQDTDLVHDQQRDTDENSGASSERARSSRWDSTRPSIRYVQSGQADKTASPTAEAGSEQKTPSKDPAYWLRLFQQERLRHGRQGLDKVWSMLQYDGSILNPNDKDALEIWNMLLARFLDDRFLLSSLVQYAGHVRKVSGAGFGFLYERIMSHSLKHRPESGLDVLASLEKLGLVPSARAGKMVLDTITSEHPSSAYKVFKQLYDSGSERNLYETCYKALKQNSASYRTLFKWHTLLLSHGDLPTTTLLHDPVVKVLLARSRRLPFAKDLIIASQVSRDADASKHELRFTREYMNSIVGEVHGIKQKSVSDAFCARVFATGGLSTGFLIGGLAMLGLDTIGPLAMRELAARSQTTKAFLEALRTIKEREITITPCAFSKVLQSFALEERQDVFETLIQSDRHPDTYEDNELMQRLADTYLKEGRANEAHALLAVLSITAIQSEKDRWNMLLQAECRLHNQAKVTAVMQDMIVERLPIFDSTIASLRLEMLRPRVEGKRPQITGRRSAHDEDDLTYVTNLLLSVARTGKAVHHSHWRELFKRYGMEGRMHGLRALTLELVRLYQTAPRVAGFAHDRFTQDLPAAFSRFDHPLRQLFNTILQRAIIDWGFHSEKSERWLPAALRTPSTQAASEETWLRGINLLLILRDAGMPLDIPALRDETTKQLAKLYRPRLESRLGPELVVTDNDAELVRRFEMIEQAWGTRGLFNFSSSDPVADPQHLLHRLFIESGWLTKKRRRGRRSVESD